MDTQSVRVSGKARPLPLSRGNTIYEKYDLYPSYTRKLCNPVFAASLPHDCVGLCLQGARDQQLDLKRALTCPFAARLSNRGTSSDSVISHIFSRSFIFMSYLCFCLCTFYKPTFSLLLVLSLIICMKTTNSDQCPLHISTPVIPLMLPLPHILV
jgi:hypothetical protein